MEARDRGPWGQHLEEVTPREDRPADHRVTPARGERIHRMLEPSKPRAAREHRRFGVGRSGRGNGKEGWPRREAGRLPVGGNLRRRKTQERRRHETRPAGLRAEQSVKRPRKSEGAAQPGEASPVWVASRYLIR